MCCYDATLAGISSDEKWEGDNPDLKSPVPWRRIIAPSAASDTDSASCWSMSCTILVACRMVLTQSQKCRFSITGRSQEPLNGGCIPRDMRRVSYLVSYGQK